MQTVDKIDFIQFMATIAELPQTALARQRNSSPETNNLTESPENIARVRSALESISANCDYATWRNTLWAMASTNWTCAESMACDWSMTAPERYQAESFNNVWDGFDPEAGITLGTLFHYAQQAGWRVPATPISGDAEGDLLNGRLFSNHYRDKLKFIYETGDILIFLTEAGWVHAPPCEAEKSAKDIVFSLREDAARAYSRDPASGETKRKMAHASRSCMEPRIRAMISMAKSEAEMTARLSDFDADPYLLGMSNGVLDLRTSKLLQPTPETLVSMRARVAFDPDARCPKWMSFLDAVQPDKGVQRLLQQLVGVFLTGKSDIQKLLIIYGLGANGKSTFIELIAWILGDYAQRIATEMLMHHQRNPQGPSPDIVALKGCRLAYCNEVEEGRRIDEARVKDLTGGDTLTGRAPYAKANVSFAPSHKICMVGNHKPEVHDTSHGMWRRMLLVPFDVTISADKRDPHLMDKLKAEASGILNWALAGLRDYHRHGLRIPNVISAATEAYKDEEDLLGEWLQEHFNSKPSALASIAKCYSAYCFWAKTHGHNPLAQRNLTRRLKDRGINRDAGKRHYVGLELNQAGEGAVDGWRS